MKYVIKTDTEGSIGRIYWCDIHDIIVPGSYVTVQYTAMLTEAMVFDSREDAHHELITNAAKSTFNGLEVIEIDERELFEARLKGV